MLLGKLALKRVRGRLLRERLTEPLHLNLLSIPVALFGSYESRIEWDLVLRPHNAWGLREGARRAKSLGARSMTAIEFGVGSGTGLVNMTRIAARVERLFGIRIRILGFDTGHGLPPPRDHRDHPEMYREGSYPMDPDRLRAALTPGTELILGDLRDTVPLHLARLSSESPVGYAALDVDYFSSTVEALKLFTGPAEAFLPTTPVYVDDLDLTGHNPWCGALGAIGEFNREQPLRKLAPDTMLVHERFFKHARWLSHMYQLHVLDHPRRRGPGAPAPPVVHRNPYLPSGLP